MTIKKTHQDTRTHLHGTLKKNQGDFCKKESSSTEREWQMQILEDGNQCSCYAEYEVNEKKHIGLYCRNGTGKTEYLYSSTDAMDNPMGVDHVFYGRNDR